MYIYICTVCSTSTLHRRCAQGLFYFDDPKRKSHYFAYLTGVSSSLSAPLCNHLLRGRVNVLCSPPCFRGAGQDGRHAFRDALLRGVSFCVCPLFTCGNLPGASRDLSSIHKRHFPPPTSINQAVPPESGFTSPTDAS